MKGGCFGKILTFILGIFVGIILVVGTLAGVIYYAVAGVTINKVEEVSGQSFENVIAKDAEIREMSILDLVSYVQSNDFSNITVDGAKKKLGVDVITLLSESLDIEFSEQEKADLGDVPLLKLFQDDNIKKLLNCVTMGTLTDKVGLETSTGLASKPIFQEHIDEPVMDAINSILSSIEINDMTIAEMEYLLGVSFGSEGILNEIEGYKISTLNDAIDTLKFEKIISDLDRDLYTKISDPTYVKSTTRQEFTYKSLVNDGILVIDTSATKDSSKTYYEVDFENGTVKASDTGKYYVKTSLPDFRERYSAKLVNGAVDVSTRTQNRFGLYYINAGDVRSEDRYDKDGNQDNFGQYFYNYTPSAAGTYLKAYAAVKTAGRDEYTWEERGYVAINADYKITTSYYKIDSNKKLVSATYADADCVLIHTGKSQEILKALADETLKTIDKAIGDVKLGDVIEVNADSEVILQTLKDKKISEIDGVIKTLTLKEVIKIDTSSSTIMQSLKDKKISELDTAINNELKLGQMIEINETSPAVLKELKNSTLNSISNDIKNIKLSKLMTINEKNIAVKDSGGEFIALPTGNDNEFIGTYTTAYLQSSTTPLYLVKYTSDCAGWETERYRIITERSNDIAVALADKTVNELETMNMSTLINNARLDGIIEISGNVYQKLNETTYADAIVGVGKDVYYVDSEGVIVTAKATNLAPYYQLVYSGTSNAVVKKIATLKASQLADGNALNGAVNDCKLSDFITPKDGLLSKVSNSKISELETTVTDTLTNATVRELNEWGSLGMQLATINALNKKKYIDYCTANSETPDVAYDGTDTTYDMTAKEFLSGLSIGVDGAGNLTISYTAP